jgi:hypothetical protein
LHFDCLLTGIRSFCHSGGGLSQRRYEYKLRGVYQNRSSSQ